MTEADAGPLYQRLADKLTEDIRRGALQPGNQLPTQRELAAQLGTTIGTVGRAYSLLHERGLVSQEVGRGTYVEPVPKTDVTATAPPARAVLLAKVSEMEKQIADLRKMIEQL